MIEFLRLLWGCFAAGDGSDGHFVPIVAFPYPLWPFGPSPPDRGSRPRTPFYGSAN